MASCYENQTWDHEGCFPNDGGWFPNHSPGSSHSLAALFGPNPGYQLAEKYQEYRRRREAGEPLDINAMAIPELIQLAMRAPRALRVFGLERWDEFFAHVSVELLRRIAIEHNIADAYEWLPPQYELSWRLVTEVEFQLIRDRAADQVLQRVFEANPLQRETWADFAQRRERCGSVPHEWELELFDRGVATPATTSPQKNESHDAIAFLRRVAPKSTPIRPEVRHAIIPLACAVRWNCVTELSCYVEAQGVRCLRPFQRWFDQPAVTLRQERCQRYVVAMQREAERTSIFREW